MRAIKKSELLDFNFTNINGIKFGFESLPEKITGLDILNSNLTDKQKIYFVLQKDLLKRIKQIEFAFYCADNCKYLYNEHTYAPILNEIFIKGKEFKLKKSFVELRNFLQEFRPVLDQGAKIVPEIDKELGLEKWINSTVRLAAWSTISSALSIYSSRREAEKSEIEYYAWTSARSSNKALGGNTWSAQIEKIKMLF